VSALFLPIEPFSFGPLRFTEEGDQQRALIEMHGLYCLSRPSTLLGSNLILNIAYVSPLISEDFARHCEA
jgi:hypothetical protein